VLDFLTNWHLYIYYQVLVVATTATVWGGICWRQGVYTDGLRSILYVTAGTGVLQALLGSILYLAGCRPNNSLHLVYGGIILLAIPVAYVYINEKITKRDVAVLAFAAFALLAAAFRAYSTGVGGSCPVK
jgi:peptidoglycan/LPS O-acetylase OafA/YrhL